MLVVKAKYEKDEIVTFKLANGDEIIAKVVGEEDETFTISKPLAVIPSQNGLALVPALFSVNPDKTVPLSKKHIMMDAETVEEVKAYYLTKTTVIATIPKGKIIT